MPENKIKILIAEDEPALSKALDLKLTSAGFETKKVKNGQEALDMFKQDTFDLLILDLMMPIMDGYTVLEELKKLDSKVPTIVLSNLGQGEDVKKAKNLGATEYFIKADTPLSEIIVQIKRVLNL